MSFLGSLTDLLDRGPENLNPFIFLSDHPWGRLPYLIFANLCGHIGHLTSPLYLRLFTISVHRRCLDTAWGVGVLTLAALYSFVLLTSIYPAPSPLVHNWLFYLLSMAGQLVFIISCTCNYSARHGHFFGSRSGLL